MTLARTALRLCVTACLEGSADARPTIAEGRVYDSRIAEIAPESFVADALPTVILLSDNDEGDALSVQNGGPPFRRSIDIVFETGMTQAIKDGDDYVVIYPDTDAQLEASLELLQFQIVQRLAYDPDPLCVLFRKFVRIRRQESHRQVLDESSIKIACRIMTLTCEVSDDQVGVRNAAAPSPDSFDVLPEPLRSVALALPVGSPGHEICTSLAAALSPITSPAFEGINFKYDADPEHKAARIEAQVDFPQT